MNNIPSLHDMCITTIAEFKYHNPDATIPFEGIPSEIINRLFSRIVCSDNQVTVRMPPNGETLKISLPHTATLHELVTKIALILNVPAPHICLSCTERRLGKRVVTSGFNTSTLCAWAGIKLGEPVVFDLTYFPSRPGCGYPKWPGRAHP